MLLHFLVSVLSLLAISLIGSATNSPSCPSLPPLFTASASFAAFDADGDGAISTGEFRLLLRCLLPPDEDGSGGGFVYDPDAVLDRALLSAGLKRPAGEADLDLSEEDFASSVWQHLLRPLSRRSSLALLVIDVQNDFISGSLALKDAPAKQDGHDVLAPINRLTPLFDHVVYSLDWHPPDHVSFFSNLELRRDQLLSDDAASLRPLSVARFSGPPPFNQTLWPDHCVQGTHGAQLHKDLKISVDAMYLHKGTNPDVDSYSAFFDNLGAGGGDTGLRGMLEDVSVGAAVVAGLATDYCVGSTALDALSPRVGITAVVVEDASCGVDKDTIAAMRRRLLAAGGVLASSAGVERLLAAATGEERVAAAAAVLDEAWFSLAVVLCSSCVVHIRDM